MQRGVESGVCSGVVSGVEGRSSDGGGVMSDSFYQTLFPNYPKRDHSMLSLTTRRKKLASAVVQGLNVSCNAGKSGLQSSGCGKTMHGSNVTVCSGVKKVKVQNVAVCTPVQSVSGVNSTPVQSAPRAVSTPVQSVPRAVSTPVQAVIPVGTGVGNTTSVGTAVGKSASAANGVGKSASAASGFGKSASAVTGVGNSGSAGNGLGKTASVGSAPVHTGSVGSGSVVNAGGGSVQNNDIVSNAVLRDGVGGANNQTRNKGTSKFDYCSTVELDISDISDEEIPDRFGSPISNSGMADIVKKDIPLRTQRAISWAENLFEQWRKKRNVRILKEGKYGPAFLINKTLQDMTVLDLNYAVARFIAEVRKADKSHFPPRTIRQLVLLIQMKLNSLGNPCKLLSHPEYICIQNACDNIMKKRAEEGLGLKTKQAEVIDSNKENFLWASGILGNRTPLQLLDTVVFLIGLNYALRSGDEHRNLTRGQLQLKYCEDGQECLVYTEKFSKANRRGLKDVGVKRKIVTCYQNVINPERCLVKLYKQYLSLCPDVSDEGAFYLQPLKKSRPNRWYGIQPVGRNKLYKTVQRICGQAGFKGNYNFI